MSCKSRFYKDKTCCIFFRNNNNINFLMKLSLKSESETYQILQFIELSSLLNTLLYKKMILKFF